MGELVSFQDDLKIDTMTLEEALDELSKFGDPRLGVYGGWHCSIKVFVTGKGVQFEVKSGFDNHKPIDAVRVCLNRLKKALKEIKEGKK